MFFNNTFYWGDNILYRPRYRQPYSYIWQTNRTFGDTKLFNPAANRIVDSGTVTERRNGNLETTFSTSGQTTQKQPFRGVFRKKCLEKHAGEHPCRSLISIKLLCNFIEIALWHGCSPVNLLYIFGTSFPRKTSGQLLLATFNWKYIAKMFMWRLMHVQFRLFFHCRGVLVELIMLRNCP